jgi:hypothetical protein
VASTVNSGRLPLKPSDHDTAQCTHHKFKQNFKTLLKLSCLSTCSWLVPRLFWSHPCQAGHCWQGLLATITS